MQKEIEHSIDHDKSPELPYDGANIEEHRGVGISKIERNGDDLYLDGKKITLYLAEEQKKNRGRIVGDELFLKLASLPVLDANVLDYLLKYPKLIPESWKIDDQGRPLYIFFWGTIFSTSDDRTLHVRHLSWKDGEWQSNYSWLGSECFENNVAAVLES